MHPEEEVALSNPTKLSLGAHAQMEHAQPTHYRANECLDQLPKQIYSFFFQAVIPTIQH